jgi:hypothetical protein
MDFKTIDILKLMIILEIIFAEETPLAQELFRYFGSVKCKNEVDEWFQPGWKALHKSG